MSATEIKFGGFGGQGVILAGIIIGRAASIYNDKFATLTQSFGPEARGSACSAQVIVSNEKILYPYVTRPDMLLVMSQEACNKFLPEATDDATIIIEEDSGEASGTQARHEAVWHSGDTAGGRTRQKNDSEHRDGGLFYRRDETCRIRSRARGRHRLRARRHRID